MPNRRGRWYARGALGLLVACSGGAPSSPPPPPPPMVGAAGGTVSGPGGARVVVPAGALASSVAIAIEQSAAGAPVLPEGFAARGPVFAFTPHGTVFALPATITVPFDPAAIPTTVAARLFKTSSQGQWEAVAGASVGTGLVTAAVNGFSWLVVGNHPPLISAQPRGGSVVAPASASFSVGALGAPPLTYQWQRSDDDRSTWNDLPGATEATYSTGPTIAGIVNHPAYYRVVVTNPDGSRTSEEIRLYVHELALVFIDAPVDVVIGGTMPPVLVELRDGQGQRVFGATDDVRAWGYIAGLSLEQNAWLEFGFRAAVDGRATFDDLSFTHLALVDGSRVDLTFTSERAKGISTPIFVHRPVPEGVEAFAGGAETATVGTAVVVPPAVRVFDSLGRSISGHAVTFAALDGTLTGPTQLTNGQGVASVGSWTLGPLPGVNRLTATAEGLEPITFFATAVAPTFDASVVSAGWDFTCAVSRTTNPETTSLPYCWGDNTYSQLGEGTQTARSRPTALAGGLVPMTQVSSGYRFACGLAAAPNAGAAICWGSNWYGQLGIGTADVDQHATPVAVDGGHVFQQIAAGFGHVCALDTDGAAWCWGAESEGNLGVGEDRTGNMRPLRVAGLLHFIAIEVGGNTSCGIVDDGDVWCWGNNGYGQLGNDSIEARSYVPVKVAGGRAFGQISVGTFHVCGVSAGGVYCWGRNVEGQLGIEATSSGSALPVPAVGALGTTVRVAAGNTHTCSVSSDGYAYCWGGNDNGQLGDGTTTQRTSGVVVQTDARFTKITTGLLHTCAIQADGAWNGATYCWGSNGSGRLGTGTLTQLTRPVRVVAP